MKRKLLLIATLLLCCLSLKAQNYVKELYFDARGSMFNTFDSSNNESHYYKGFTGDFFNLNIKGDISNNVSYRVRQRLNKRITSDNPFNATDFLYIDWRINNKWTLNFGKQEIYIGGFEYDYAPIDVYYWGYFCDTLSQSYAFSASLGYNFSQDNTLIFQVCQSPWGINNFSNNHKDNLLAYNLIWFGKLFSWWKTIWSVNEMEYQRGKFMNIVALGNRFEYDNIYLEADINNRHYSTDDNVLFDNWSFTGKFNYAYKDFNFFVKGGYDKQTMGNYEQSNTFFGGAVEYFPLKDSKDLRLHAAIYHYENQKDITHFDVGLSWKINIIKNK